MFHHQIEFWSEATSKSGNRIGKPKSAKSPMECLEKCQGQTGCNEFLFNPAKDKCELYTEISLESKDGRDYTIMKNGASRFSIHGKMEFCDEESLKNCKAFQ